MKMPFGTSERRRPLMGRSPGRSTARAGWPVLREPGRILRLLGPGERHDRVVALEHLLPGCLRDADARDLQAAEAHLDDAVAADEAEDRAIAAAVLEIRL